MNESIGITGIGSISSLGDNRDIIWENYESAKHFLSVQKIANEVNITGKINTNRGIEKLRNEDEKYGRLDLSVLYALYASREACRKAKWSSQDNFGVNIGSSRGATELFEKYYSEFLNEGKSSTLSSPTTTLGNISSWVGHDLKTMGPQISHSITCSTGLHSLLNGVAWIKSGMTNKFMVGGSEAPLTPFTLAQMRALKIYAKENKEYPCRALDLQKTVNTMVLGEGACSICLERNPQEVNTLAYIRGVGYATEVLTHNISISSDAKCFQHSMKMALKNINEEEIDVIVMHAPGTIKGDLSEYKAIQKIFGEKRPFLTSNKWKIGHTFGASGLLSVEMAILMIQYQKTIDVPYIQKQRTPNSIKNVLINAVGFGGNAVSIVLSNNEFYGRS
ncbi:3-oxoacyl-(acyl-carrier-protein) synthase [Tenacibaculum sp. MAR_2009_124]|uniref:beta-ketoacyl synthase N-terminal-like domain-containing protein n=1 Tax=Tenacibaculum sp. MAR_2009_124 TaxID=1250059 RepID=UPI00089A6C59|nr:beta-ketoacyl synthase N-terminal-like domain-containing protein [Tenacibaculum sp. MAR_2009_124]SEC94105.1 3-oxoacyl-(acyl-carrier-protein) synthase [Tenacibaculum sp. MAR_2009_124]